MIYTVLTSVVVCGSLFGVLLALSAYVNKKASCIRVFQDEEGEYRTSKWYWITLIGFFVFLFAGTFFSAHSGIDQFRPGFLVVPALMFLFFGLPLIYAGFATKVKIEGGKVYYHNGLNCREFSLENIIKCELSSYFLIEVIHARDPKKPIIISPMFKDLPRLVAILTKKQ
ncbi:MAG: hypothetical protein LAT55_03185 [Opitutales bacterium]|nr:hypothetical protein [Opitutales bacterium]